MKDELEPTYTDHDLDMHARLLIEMSREAIPGDMGVMIVMVDGCKLEGRRLRTRMVTNLRREVVDAVFEARKFDTQVVIPKKHFFMRADPGKYEFKCGG